MNKPVLCVDDDLNLLEGLVRQFRSDFDLQTAESAEAALVLLETNTPYSVIVSDLRMPGMDGIQFLARCRTLRPDSARILLTGNADLQAAIEAINQGSVFRLLTKPCPADVLGAAIQAGIEYHRLLTVERELLRDTLTGSIRMMTEVLAKVQPIAFGRGARIRKMARHVAAELSLAEAWQYELAAMLSHLGCMLLPVQLIEAVNNPDILSTSDRRLLASYPEKGARLIEHIPRMEAIAAMIRHQNGPPAPSADESGSSTDPAAIGARLLRTCLDLDRLSSQGLSVHTALQWMRSQASNYPPEFLNALETFVPEGKEKPEAVAAPAA